MGSFHVKKLELEKKTQERALGQGCNISSKAGAGFVRQKFLLAPVLSLTAEGTCLCD